MEYKKRTNLRQWHSQSVIVFSNQIHNFCLNTRNFRSNSNELRSKVRYDKKIQATALSNSVEEVQTKGLQDANTGKLEGIVETTELEPLTITDTYVYKSFELRKKPLKSLHVTFV